MCGDKRESIEVKDMGIEECIEELEKLTKKLSVKISYLENVNNDKWVSAKGLAEIMGCSTNNI